MWDGVERVERKRDRGGGEGERDRGGGEGEGWGREREGEGLGVEREGGGERGRLKRERERESIYLSVQQA